MKSFLTLICFYIIINVPAQNNDSLHTAKNSTDEAFVFVDQMPEYIGGISALYTFIGKNIRYPKKAKKAGITGKGFYKFIVDTNGAVPKVEIMRGVQNCTACDEEAVRVLKKLKFIPGVLKGKKVSVWYTLTINFALKDY